MSSVCCCFECVHEMEAGVIESCGKFSRVVPAGCVCLMCPCERIVARIPLRINYMEVQCDTKTKDNVFVRVVVAGKSTLCAPPSTQQTVKQVNWLFLHIIVCFFSAIPCSGGQGAQCLLQADRQPQTDHVLRVRRDPRLCASHGTGRSLRVEGPHRQRRQGPALHLHGRVRLRDRGYPGRRLGSFRQRQAGDERNQR